MNVRLGSIALATALLALPAAASPSVTPGADEVLRRLPGDTIAVAFVRWAELRASELYRGCEEQYAFERGEMGFDEVVALTGVDPERDVDTFAVALTRGEAEHPDAVGLATGRFDRARIEAALAAQAKPLVRTESTLATIWSAGPDAGEGALALVGDGLLVFGDRPSVDRVVAGGSSAPTALASALDGRAARGQIWGAAQISELIPARELRKEGVPAPLAAMASVRWVRFSAEVGADLELELQAVASTPEEGDLLRESLEGLVAMTKLGAKDDPLVLSMLAETLVSSDGPSVTLSTVVPRAVLERRAQRAESAASRRDR